MTIVTDECYEEYKRMKLRLEQTASEFEDKPLNPKNRFDLEQELMDCWDVTTDINDLYEYVGDSEFFAGMSAEHTDKLMNLLLGIKEIYEVKFQRTFRTFEQCISNREL